MSLKINGKRKNTPDASSCTCWTVCAYVGKDAALRRAEDDKANHVHEWIIKNEICVQSLGRVALYQRMIVCFTVFPLRCKLLSFNKVAQMI